MAQDRASVISNINNSLPTNGNEEISASDLRGVVISEVVDNFFNLSDDSELPLYDLAKTYKLGKIVLNQSMIWRAVINVPISQPPPTLPTTSNTHWTLVGTTIISETTQVEIENPSTINGTTFASPRRWWQGFNKALTLALSWVSKNTFSAGINVATSSAPTTNGDFVFNTTAGAYQGRIGGVNYNFPTSLNGRVGRVLFVSKDGNDSSAIVGSQIFTYFTIQGAINASSTGDLIIVFTGTYTENLVLGTKVLRLELHNAVISGSITLSNFSGNTIEMFGSSELASNGGVVISSSNAGLDITGGKITCASSSIGLAFTSCNIRNCRINITGSGIGIRLVNGTFNFYDCYITSNNGINIEVSGSLSYVNIHNCIIINTSASNATIVSSFLNGDIKIYNSYVRNQNNNCLLGSSNSPSFYIHSSDIISNTIVAITSASSLKLVVLSSFVYGGNNCIGRSIGANVSKIEVLSSRLYANTGEILTGNPTGAGTKCLLRNSNYNKALPASQLPPLDTTVTDSNPYIDTDMVLPPLTLT